MIDPIRCEHQSAGPATEEACEPELPTLIEELANPARTITSPTGRTVSVQADGEMDQITVRAHGGEVVLRIEVGPQGPVLRFDAAEIELAATKRIAVKAPKVEIAAAEHLELASDGAMATIVRGTRHSRVAGSDRLEAAAIESQAERGVTVRAGGRIALDGEHIGLNDDPCPAPFAWSDAARDDEEP